MDLLIMLLISVLLFVLYVYYHKRYPILNMPLDYQYRVFKRAYRAYQSVSSGSKLYKIYAEDFICPYKRSLEGKTKANSDEYIVANRLCNIIENNQEMVERYFTNRFGYIEFLNMMSEYNLFQEQVKAVADSNTSDNNHQRTITLFRKLMLFKAIFRASNIDIDMTDEARFIRNLLDIEPNTKNISNTNIYKQLKKLRREATEDREVASRIKDLEYVIEQLEYLGLANEQAKLANELEDYKKL